MKMLEGKVAAVTGAASGLGRAMALAFAGEGMHAALADVDEPGLKSTLNEVQSRGVRAFAMRVDVSRYQEVESFCSKAIAQFGATHVVCNNAGVSPLGAVWENTLADWQWILGVNLWGVIHGVRAFVPRLLAQGEGHVVNTASVAGLISPPGMGAYNVPKHAVVALSESLYHDLRLRDHGVLGHVVCTHPGRRDQSRDRRGVDDVALALREEPRHEGAHAVDHAPEVDAQDPLPVGERVLPHRAERRHAGVVAHDMRRAELRDRLAAKRFNFLITRHVDPHGERTHAAALNFIQGAFQTQL